jgi:hypothetical protein
MEIQIDPPETGSEKSFDVTEVTPDNQQRGRTSAGHPVRGGRLPEDEQDAQEQRQDESTGGPDGDSNVAQNQEKLAL